MIQLVFGGSASGKSEYAEQLIRELPGPRIYLATMQVYDAESAERVERHRSRRASLGFRTIECHGPLDGVELPHGSSLLLECLGNLVANLLFGAVTSSAPAASDVPAPSVAPFSLALEDRVALAERDAANSIDHLIATANDLVMVGNDVFGDGVPSDPATAAYLEALAFTERYAASRSDRVVEVVCGIPLDVLPARMEAVRC